MAQAIADQDNGDLYLAIRQYIDAPLWTIDPTIDALSDVLPAPIGGSDDNHNANTTDLASCGALCAENSGQ